MIGVASSARLSVAAATVVRAAVPAAAAAPASGPAGARTASSRPAPAGRCRGSPAAPRSAGGRRRPRSASAPVAALEESISCASSSSRLPTAALSKLRFPTSRAISSSRAASARPTCRRSELTAAEAAQRAAELATAPLEASAEPGDQQPQVVAGVGVEHLEHLVDVDVGERVGERDRPALLVLAGGAAARVELEEHVLQRRLRVASGSPRRGRSAGSGARCRS